MPALTLSPRLAMLPLWAMLAGREWFAERGGPLLEVRIGGRRPTPTPRELLDVADSEGVRGLWFKVDGFHGGWATLGSLREAVLAVRRAGKFVAFELESCGNAELYLASAGDRVWVRPMVQVHLLGVGAHLRFAGEALERFGLRFDVESAGAYKSFGETFTRSYASPENREAVGELVADLQEELEAAIAAGRRVDRAVVRKALEDAPLDPEEAVRRGLIDGALYPDAVHAELESLFGEDFPVRALHRWHAVHMARTHLEAWMEGRPRVVVLHLAGPVVDGDGAPGVQAIAARTVMKALDELAEDDDVSAAVLDIRSPGGSATASDVIWRGVARLQEKKPVIAVFGDVAASGGYYIAAPAAEIFARPGTLTGSIGVVGGKLVIGPALSRVGVHTELILGAPLASYFSAETPFDDVQRERFRASLQRFYKAFVDRVASGRRRPYDAIHAVAQGRVWTGRRAIEAGLVDRMGGLEDGVTRAAQLAGAHAARRVDVYLGAPQGRLVRLVRSLMESAFPSLRLLPELPESARVLLESKGAPLALSVWDVEIL